LVLDREGYSSEFFSPMKQRRIAVLSYHQVPGERAGRSMNSATAVSELLISSVVSGMEGD
jgi:hypothetical protein